MNKFSFTPVRLGLVVLAVGLSGCSAFNPAGSGEYSCPGMPMGVTCKTPAAVYKSTHGEIAASEFDLPAGQVTSSKEVSTESVPAQIRRPVTSGAAVPVGTANAASRTDIAGPRPVRESAKVVRVWIAPWVDKSDTLHLAQYHFSEVVPRTWTVGKPEVASGSGYVIPHLAFDSISSPDVGGGSPNGRTEKRSSPSSSGGVGNSQTGGNGDEMVEPN